jgi:hypothetical protein
VATMSATTPKFIRKSVGPAPDSTGGAGEPGRDPDARARHTRTPDEPPLTGTAGRSRAPLARHIVRTNPADRRKLDRRALLTDAETTARWTAGRLGPDEALPASVLRENGVRPEHMMVSVRHETILTRLRDGMAPEQAPRILRDAGEL